MWAHAVLEIYQLMDASGDLLPWPTKGLPADWIEQNSVGYYQGRAEDLVAFIPLRRLLWWKIKATAIGLMDRHSSFLVRLFKVRCPVKQHDSQVVLF